jgi:hypothetical protein
MPDRGGITIKAPDPTFVVARRPASGSARCFTSCTQESLTDLQSNSFRNIISLDQ